MVARNKTGKGYFKQRGDEPLSKNPIAIRLPESQDAELRERLGPELTEWIRKAIAERWEIDKKALSDKSS